MRDRIQRFMAGRYGNDQFNQFLYVVTIILLVLALIFSRPIFYVIGVVCLVYSYIRAFSKDINKRYAQNTRFLEIWDSVVDRFRGRKSSSSRDKSRSSSGSGSGGSTAYHIYTCPQCRQKIRIPKGKGRVNITCPKCRHQFIKRT